MAVAFGNVKNLSTAKRVSALIAVLCTTLVLGAAAAGQPAEARSGTYNLDIPSQSLNDALQALAIISQHKLLYSSELVDGKNSPAIKGQFTTEQAVKALLSGTNLSYEVTSDGLVLIRAAGESASSKDTPAKPTSMSMAAVGPSIRLAQTQNTNSQSSTDNQSIPSPKDKSLDSSESKESEKGIPEILVKGSAITNVDVKRTEDDAQPYTILTSEQIEQSGATNVEDFLKQYLTMNTAFTSNNQNYGGNGTSSINLRGLGAASTLILIDGRRSARVSSTQGNSNQSDINGIPIDAIERIEVLPTSASAIYGGAALGGVVNIILKKNYEGGSVGYSYDNTMDASAPLKRVSAAYGLTLEDGRTRVMVSGSYYRGAALTNEDRSDLMERGINTILGNSPSYLYNPYQPFAGATTNITTLDGSNLTLKNGTSLNSPITFIPPGSVPGANLSAGLLANAGRYNLNLSPGTGLYGLANTIGIAPLDKSLGFNVRREMSSWLDIFSEFSTLTNASTQITNPLAGYSFPVPSTAPDNPFQQNVYVAFPSALTPTTISDSVTQSVTTGAVAKLPYGWSSELDYTWSRNSFETIYSAADYNNIQSALARGAIDPFADTIAHPLNLTPYLAPSLLSGANTLNDLALRVSGTLGSFPWGQPVLTIGLEHRKEGSKDSISETSYPLSPAASSILEYFGQPQTTNSMYAEANVPLVTTVNAIPFVQALELQLAGRSELYTVEARTPYIILSPTIYTPYSPPQGVESKIDYTSTNPTIGVKWKPVGTTTLRGSFAKAFLPPTAAQFLRDPKPQCGYPCIPIVDPKNGESYLVDYLAGGNPDLKPQTSRAWDFGVIYEPEGLLSGLRADLEYYDIAIPNYILSPSPGVIVSNPMLASRVTRDPTTGLITLVDASALNATRYKTAGWDLALDYTKVTALGTVAVHGAGTMLSRDDRQYAIGGPFANYVGYPGEGGEAKYKGNLTLTWEHRGLTLGWSATYFGAYRQELSPGSPFDLQYGYHGSYTYYTAAQGGDSIPAQTVHDIFAQYAFGAASLGRPVHGALSHITVQAGVKNVFNSLPPFDALNSPYFYSGYGDPRLRSYQLTLKKGF